MRTRHALELAVGTGLLLGPLVYALTLEPAPECAAESSATVEPAEAVVVERCGPPEPEVVVVERCDPPEPVEVAPEPPAEPEPKPLAELPESDRATFLFVTDVGVVLSTEVEDSWGTGRLFEPDGSANFRVAKQADPAALPAALLAQGGRSYDVYGKAGKVCTARLGELRVVAQYDGWSLGGVLGDEWYDEDPAGASKAEIRAGLWDLEQRWLVAELESDEDCGGGLWARDAELPAPTILRRSTEPTPSSRARLSSFTASPEFSELERAYVQTYAERIAESPELGEFYPDWATLSQTDGATAWSWLDAQDQPTFVGLEFGPLSEGCGDPFDARFTALDQIDGSQFVATGRTYDPAAIVDVDLDGQFEFLYTEDLDRHLSSATLSESLTVDQDWYCPC